MKTPWLWSLAIVLTFLLSNESVARAEHPSYILLQTPTAKGGEHPTHGYSPGYGFGVNTHSYSYGWFGVQPRQHATRHFGFSRNYTQWTKK